MELEVVRTGELLIPDPYVFRGTILPRLRRAPCLAYVVRHPEAGTILIDTGFHPDARRDKRRDFGGLMAAFFASLRPDRLGFADQLRSRGVEPDEVELVVMTHLHVDHTSGMRLLPRAEFVCSREEWRAATRPSADRRGYAPHHLPPEDRLRLIDPGEDIDLLGDGTLTLLSTPGHVSLLVRLAGDGKVLVVGDAAYTVRSIREERLPLVTTDDASSRRSLARLRALTDSEPEAIVVPSHDPDAWRALAA